MHGPRNPVDDARRKNPSDVRLFVRLLKQTKPERVLVLGKTNWRYLPSDDPDDDSRHFCHDSNFELQLPGKLAESERNAYWYRTGSGKWALVGAIMHPSSAGFSIGQWRRWVKRFMEFDGNPPAD
jgi:hypothetical protein